MDTFKIRKAALIGQAKWLMDLARRIEFAAENYSEECQSRNNGTITNLCPELAKGAAKMRKMSRAEYFNVEGGQ